MCSLSEAIRYSSPNQLLAFLQNAKVKSGFWRGRMIEIPGYSGMVTFSQIASRVETLYQLKMRPTQLRDAQYMQKTKPHDSTRILMPALGRGSLFFNLVFLPYTLPYELAATGMDAYRLATTPYPEISETEERSVIPVLKWRKTIDATLSQLFTESQKEVDRSSYFNIFWDTRLDRLSSWRNNKHVEDEKMVSKAVESRFKREHPVLSKIRFLSSSLLFSSPL